MIKYLTKKQILTINRETILRHGGNYVNPDNILHEENLSYLIDSVKADLFGQPMYPTLQEKASVYCHHIICNHIFSDGNKRTGLASALQFLNINNHQLRESVSNEELTEFILSVASGVLSLDECKSWFEIHISTLKEI